MEVEVKLSGYPVIWRSGKEIISVELVQGQQDRSSSCRVLLADPENRIAADLIDHTLEQGGIQAIPGPVQNTSGVAGTSKGTGQGTFDTSLSPQRRAFLDVIAYAEGADYNTLFGGGTFSDYSRHPDTVVTSGGYSSSAAGRYQFLTPTWNDLGLPDFSPANQDKGAIILLQQNGALPKIDAGDIEGAIYASNATWASFPGGPYDQPQKPLSELLKVYQDRLAAYSGGTVSVSKVEPSTSTQATQAPFKGNKLTITIYLDGDPEGYSFEYFHQGTDTDHQGNTTLSGQGIRWVLNRRTRNKTESSISFKELCDRLCKAHSLKLDYRASFDPSYVFLDQSGLTDYQLLLREADRLGLYLSEANGTLTVSALDNVRDTQLTLQPGINLMTWSVKDQAIDANAEDISSALRQSEPKVTLDPLTGQFHQQVLEVDSTKAKDVTGRSKSELKGTLKPSDEVKAGANRARYKRVKGLPSTFVIPLDTYSIDLKPLDAIRTKGLPGVLSRVWMIDSVSHSIPAMTTTLSVFSPVETLNLGTPTGAGASATNPGGFIDPNPGSTLTSPFGMRTNPVTGVYRLHAGVDLASASGTPIKAAATGTVTVASYVGDYGNVVYISHPDGYQTRYAHLSAIQVSEGQQVNQGDTIGLEGSTGASTGPHLHFEIRDPSGNPIDPAPLIGR